MSRLFFSTVVFLVLSFSPALRSQVSFFAPPIYSGAGNVFAGDFNGDGKPDILTQDGTMNLGNGDGTFKTGTAVSGTSLPILAVADFNGDGKPDVLEQSVGTLLVLVGKGDGTFQSAISTASGANLGFVAAADLNADGKADVVGVFNGSLLVYISNGDGTFKAGVPYSLGSTAAVCAVVLGDVNGDKNTDVAVTLAGGNVAGQEIVFLGNGNGTFATPPATSVGVTGLYSATNALAGDFNGDGKLDLAVSGAVSTCSTTGVCPTFVQLGNGNGTFQAPVVALNVEGSMAAADVNGDGRADLVVITSVRPGTCQIYLGNVDGTFTNFRTYGITVGSLGVSTISLADFNGDGKLDLAAGAILLGNGDGTFHGVEIGVAADGGLPLAIAVGDFEKKKILDVAIVTEVMSGATQTFSVSILSNNGAGVLTLIRTYALPQTDLQTTAMAAGDFNGDGNLDLLMIGFPPSNISTWSYNILLGNGDGSFQSPVSYTQSGGPNSFAVADFNNDKKFDFVAGSVGVSSLGIFLGNGDGTFAAPVDYFDDGGSPLLVGDFNGDGKLDIAVADTSANETGILYGNGDGTFQAEVFPATLKGYQPAFVADFNNDGKPDFLSNITDQIALGNGDGTFTVLNPFNNISKSVFGYDVIAIADFNNDGNQDLVIDYGTSMTGIMLGNGDGTFAPLVDILAPNDDGAIYTPAVEADMNGDGLPDLVFPWAVRTNSGFPGIPYPSGSAVLLQVVQPNFSLSQASGSQTSQTISAGQTASFSLALAGVAGFSGTVNLTCVVSPVVTPAPTPTCSFSSSSVNISGSGVQTVTVTVGTTAASSAMPSIDLAPPRGPLVWSLLLMGTAWLLLRGRQRLTLIPATSALALVLLTCVSCGGSGSSPGNTSHTGGTPPGTYATTVTATSGGLSHTITLQVVVQ